jgi:hypothetical protein
MVISNPFSISPLSLKFKVCQLSIFKFSKFPLTGNENSIYSPWIFQNLFKRFSLEEFHLTMAQGFWRTNLWGVQHLGTEAPSGTGLFVKFTAGTEE